MHRACISLTQVGSVGGRHFTRWLLKSSGRAMVSSTNQRHSTKVGAEPFLNGTSAVYMEEMYKSWCIDPKSVHVSWQIFFSNCENDVPPGSAHQAPPLGTHVGRNLTPMFNLSPATSPALGGYLDDKLIDDHLAVQAIIRSYQARGHLVAELDPLGIMYADLHSTYTDRKGQPPESVVRNYMLGKGCESRVAFCSVASSTVPFRHNVSSY